MFESPTMRTPRVHSLAKLRHVALAVAAAGLLAGCQSTGREATGSIGAGAVAQASAQQEPPKSEPPMTRSRAAMECWMKTEKGSANANLDKRADIVTKCIDDKMKAVAAGPRG